MESAIITRKAHQDRGIGNGGLNLIEAKENPDWRDLAVDFGFEMQPSVDFA